MSDTAPTPAPTPATATAPVDDTAPDSVPAPATAPAYGYLPPAPAQPAPAGDAGMAILAGMGVMLVCAALYAGIVDATKWQISYMGVGLGAAVGFAIAKVGGRSTVLPFVSLLLSVIGVFLGQFFGLGLLAARLDGFSASELFLSHSDLVFSAWKASLDVKEVLFMAVAAYVGFILPKRVHASS